MGNDAPTGAMIALAVPIQWCMVISAPNDVASIYVLIEPHTNEIRYVGWTAGDLDARLRKHTTVAARGSRDHRGAWLRSLARLGLTPTIELVQTVGRDHWADAERYWIGYFRSLGCRLVNGTVGGEGALGLRHTAETRAKMSAAKKGKPSPLRGRALSVEQRAHLSGVATRQMERPGYREAVSAVHKGKTISPDHKRAVGEATKKRWAEWRANGCITSDETRRKISEAAKGRLGRSHTPEQRARRSEWKKQWWADRRA